MNATAQNLIQTEMNLGAHNYKPIDVMLSRGEGVWLWDVEGNRYLDCLSAYSAVNQGHCHPKILEAMVEQAAKANAMMHVSLDVDFLDPTIAPAVGTTVPGGATYREAHLVMEMLADSGLVTSLDLVELNPFMDHAGASARLMVDLVASLFGRTIMDR
jgi:hypothetical protein